MNKKMQVYQFTDSILEKRNPSLLDYFFPSDLIKTPILADSDSDKLCIYPVVIIFHSL